MPFVAPTVVLQQVAYAQLLANASRAFTQVTVAVGDRLAIIARADDADATFTSVSNTGTAALSAWTRTQNTGTVAVNCRHAVFTATVTGAGTMTATVASAAATTRFSSMDLYIATGAAATNTFVAASARQLSITPASIASYIATSAADWTAGASNGATFVPVGQGQVIDLRTTDGTSQSASTGAQFSVFCAHWPDTASAGATTYGLNTPSAGTYNSVAVEFTGSTVVAAIRAQVLLTERGDAILTEASAALTTEGV